MLSTRQNYPLIVRLYLSITIDNAVLYEKIKLFKLQSQSLNGVNMLDNFGRLVCKQCKSQMQLKVLAPIDNRNQQATYQCMFCDHEYKILITIGMRQQAA